MEQQGRSESPGSQPLQIFERHVQHVTYLIEVLERDIHAVEQMNAQTAATLLKLETEFSNSTESSNKLAFSQISTELNALIKEHQEVVAILGTNVRAQFFLYDWILVMMVTFAEAYLKDVLVLLAAAHPQWTVTGRIVVSSHDLLELAEHPRGTRWQDLMKIAGQRWVEEVLQKKPKDWIKRLRKFGASTYGPDLAAKMTAVWERRHVIVHDPPAARADRAAELIELDAARSEQNNRVKEEIDVIYRFVNATDAFVVGFLNAHPSS
jgi:hypothetical protein